MEQREAAKDEEVPIHIALIHMHTFGSLKIDWRVSTSYFLPPSRMWSYAQEARRCREFAQAFSRQEMLLVAEEARAKATAEVMLFGLESLVEYRYIDRVLAMQNFCSSLCTLSKDTRTSYFYA